MKKKIILLTLIISILTLLFTTVGVCYAAEAVDTEVGDNEVNTDAEETDAVENADGDGGTVENVFQTVFEKAKEYSAQILSALTLIGSLILAYAYKRGLFPLLEKGLNAISDTARGIKEKTDKTELVTEGMKEDLGAKLEAVERTLSGFSEELNTLSSDLDRAMRDVAERKALGIVLNEQIELLYDIFMSSTLPQYKKDAVGERVGKMKEVLRENQNLANDEAAAV